MKNVYFSWEKLFFPPKILKIVDYFLSILHQRGANTIKLCAIFYTVVKPLCARQKHPDWLTED
jgi:hypothetical protein